MKRLAVILAVISFVAGMVGTCYAASLGPVEPLGANKCEVGVEYNSVVNRDLDKAGAVTKAEVDESNQVYAKLALGVGDYLNVYGKLGMADLNQKVTWNSDYDNRSQTLGFNNGLLWGVGANGLYDLGNNVGIGGDVQLDMSFNDVDSITASNATSFSSSGSLRNTEIQASVYMTYTLQPAENFKIVPYAGGYYSYFKAAIDDAIKYADTLYEYTLRDLEGKDNFGLLLGVNVHALKNISVNVEGRLIGESAVTAGISYRF